MFSNPRQLNFSLKVKSTKDTNQNKEVLQLLPFYCFSIYEKQCN